MNPTGLTDGLILYMPENVSRPAQECLSSRSIDESLREEGNVDEFANVVIHHHWDATGPASYPFKGVDEVLIG